MQYSRQHEQAGLASVEDVRKAMRDDPTRLSFMKSLYRQLEELAADVEAQETSGNDITVVLTVRSNGKSERKLTTHYRQAS